MKKVLTQSRLQYHLQPRMIMLKDWKPPNPLLRIFLFRRFFPAELVIVLIIMIVFISAITPKIFAIPFSPSVPPAAKTAPTTSQPVEEDLNAYKTDDLIFNGEVNFATALRGDLERRFYLRLAQGDQRIVEAVYTYAADLNKDLVFALLLQESNAKPDAFNLNKNPKTGVIVSIDRGLFQLNSNSYPNLSEDDFYCIETNVKYGIAHLRGEIRYWNGNVKKALWTYNAGQNGILDGVPKRTLEYAQSIIADTKALKQAREQYIKTNIIQYTAVAVAFSKEQTQ